MAAHLGLGEGLYDALQGASRVPGGGIFEPANFPQDQLARVNIGGGANPARIARTQQAADDGSTTVMLRNIPNKYTRSMLIEQLHRAGFRGQIDYLYLPTDFANRCNVGYCFINFRTPEGRRRFTTQFDGVAAQSCLPGFNSYKVCQVTRAKWQGRDENVRRLRSGPELMAQLAAHPEWLPLLLDEDGQQEPFLCDEGISAARGPAAPRRQMRKQKGVQPQMAGMGMGPMGQMPEGYMLPGLSEMLEGAGMFGAMGGRGGGRGRGGMGGLDQNGHDRGGGRRRRGRGQSGMGGEDAYASAAAMYAGMPGMAMPVPVMTEQGMQYVPYEAAYEAAYMQPFMAMGAEQQMYGMPYPGAGYPMGMMNYWGDDGAAGPGDSQGAGKTGRQSNRRRRGNSGNSAGGGAAGADAGDL